MITNSKSFEVLKEQIQSTLDFSVLTCHAVPALKAYMKAVEGEYAEKLPDADYFKGNDNSFEQLRGFVPEYKKSLGKLVFISSFSYFEAYFKSLIAEVLKFHGGHETFLELSQEKQAIHMRTVDQDEGIRKSANKLRDYRKSGKEQKYSKHTEELENTEFRFPSELFATFGLKELGTNYQDLKASQIPYIAKWCFGVSLTKEEEGTFSSYRELRNKAAHGKLTQLDLSEATEINQFLRNLAIKIDKHVVGHYFVIEKLT
ncbi:HEPN_RiboL-PSP domain-containing protein [Vibrio chagasii]|nr:HEPN_RiboL-PSP domain-containing protein [Vibrio chagasii]